MDRIALQHVQQMLEPEQRQGCAADFFIGTFAGMTQPFKQPHQPQIAGRQFGLRIGRVEQCCEVPAGHQCRVLLSASMNSGTSV